MFELHSEQACHALVLAQEGARQSCHRQTDTAHLFYGVVSANDGLSAQALRAAGIDASDKVREAIEALTPPGKHKVVGSIPFTQEAHLSLVRAYLWSDELRNATSFPPGRANRYTGVEHILLGLLDEETDTSVGVVRKLNQDPKAIREQLVKLMAEQELVAQDAAPMLDAMSEAVLHDATKRQSPKPPPGQAAIADGFWSRVGRSR